MLLFSPSSLSSLLSQPCNLHQWQCSVASFGGVFYVLSSCLVWLIFCDGIAFLRNAHWISFIKVSPHRIVALKQATERTKDGDEMEQTQAPNTKREDELKKESEGDFIFYIVKYNKVVLIFQMFYIQMTWQNRSCPLRWTRQRDARAAHRYMATAKMRIKSISSSSRTASKHFTSDIIPFVICQRSKRVRGDGAAIQAF